MHLILDISHRADHLRQPWWDINYSRNAQKESLEKRGGIDEKSQDRIVRFMEDRAGAYLKETGVSNILKNAPENNIVQLR